MPGQFSDKQIAGLIDTLDGSLQFILDQCQKAEKTALHRAPEPGAWSLAEILVHLRSCADVWSNSIDLLLGETSPNIPYIHPNDWAKLQGYAQLPFVENLSAFIADRQQLLSRCRQLDRAAWKREGKIKGRVHTVFGEVRRLALHEIGHHQQIKDAIESVTE